MSMLNEDLAQLGEITATCDGSVIPHMEIVTEQMRAAGVSGSPLAAMAELQEAATLLGQTLAQYQAALAREGQEVGQAHSDAPEAARSGEYYDNSDA